MNAGTAVRPHSGMQLDPLDSNVLHEIKKSMLACGASDATVSASRQRSFGVSVRNGQFEDVTHDEGSNISLKAFVGQRSASVSSNYLSSEIVDTLVDRVVRMAKLASEDPYLALPESYLLVPIWDDASLELVDPFEPKLSDIERDAMELEDHALCVPGVTTSQGASFGWTSGESRAVGSNGFALHSKGTRFKAFVAAIAEGDGAREVAGFGHTARWRSDLLGLGSIGTRAGHFAVEKLGSRKIPSCRAPVIFDRRLSFSIIQPLLSAISGDAIFHKQTFLKDALDTQVFAKGFSLIEEPFRKRGLASRVKDDEGLATFTGPIVDDGVVKTYLLAFYDAKRLGLESSGHSGGTSNLKLQAGIPNQQEMMREAGTGLIVTGIMGSSANPYTGDFSMGVSGLWFEAGEIAYAVSELTIAGNFRELFADLVVGADLERLGPNDAPSILVQPLAVGGL